MQPITNSLTGETFDFSTKQELLQKAFEYYSDQFTDDEILDKANRIWNINLEQAKQTNSNNNTNQ